jgi:hypothetical protein
VNSAAKRNDAQLLHAPHFYTRRLNRWRLQKGRAELTDVSDVIEAFWHRADATANGHSISDSDDDVALADETENDETDETETDDNPFVSARTNSSSSRSSSSSPYRAPLYVHSSSSSTSAATINTSSSSAGTAATSVNGSSSGLKHPLDIDAAESGNSDSNSSSNGATAAAGFSANIHYDYFHRSNSTSSGTKVIDRRRDRTAGARGRLAPELVAQLPGLYVGHLAEETLPDSDEYGICMTSSGSSSSKSTAAKSTTAATAATTAASNGLAAPLLNDSDLQQELQVQRRRRLLRRRRAWSSLYWQQWRLRRRMRRGKQCAADAFMSGPLWLRVLRAVEMPFVLARNATVAPVEADSWK